MRSSSPNSGKDTGPSKPRAGARTADSTRVAALVSLLIGAAGSLGSMLWVGRNNGSRLLLVLMGLWVLSPFCLLLLAGRMAKRQPTFSRPLVYGTTMLIALASLFIYGAIALGPPRDKPAFAFVVMPPVSWLLITAMVMVVSFKSRMLLETRWCRRLLRGFVWLAFFCVLGGGLLLVFLWRERASILTLPQPSGSFTVGRVIYNWIDNSKADKLAPAPLTRRELLVWIWYPASSGRTNDAHAYVPAQLPALGAAPDSAILRLVTRDLFKVRSHAIPAADVSTGQASYPVLIMRTGASLGVLSYSTLAEDLASHGYIVVGFDAPYRTRVVAFPDGRVIDRIPANDPERFENQPGTVRLTELVNAWAADIGFVLDRLQRLNASDPSGRFTGRLDLRRVGVFGHSFGGAQAAQFCSLDSRCAAGADLDGRLFGSVVQTGLHRPFMFLLSDQDTSTAEGRSFMAEIQSVYDRLPGDGRLLLRIKGANHYFFSDDVALFKSRIVIGALRGLGIIRIDGRRQLQVTCYCLCRFFDTFLKNSGNVPLKLSTNRYPELQTLK